MQADLARIADFIYEEAELLDQARYEEWLELFTDDGTYWIPRSPGQTDPIGEVSLFYGSRAVLEVRVKRLRHPQVHSVVAPFRSSHIISAVRIVSVTPTAGTVRVQSRFHLHEYHEGRERHFSGRYLHELLLAGEPAKIRSKRCELVNCDAMFEPIEIPI